MKSKGVTQQLKDVESTRKPMRLPASSPLAEALAGRRRHAQLPRLLLALNSRWSFRFTASIKSATSGSSRCSAQRRIISVTPSLLAGRPKPGRVKHSFETARQPFNIAPKKVQPLSQAFRASALNLNRWEGSLLRLEPWIDAYGCEAQGKSFSCTAKASAARPGRW